MESVAPMSRPKASPSGDNPPRYQASNAPTAAPIVPCMTAFESAAATAAAAPPSAAFARLAAVPSPMPGRYLSRPHMYTIRPATMPTPAAANPMCQPLVAVAHRVAEPAADELPERRAEVDPHVEDREARIAPRVARPVELADHRRDVRLEEARPDDEQREPDVEHRHAREGEAEVTGRHDHAADHERAPRAQPAVGEVAADQRRQVDERRCRSRRASPPRACSSGAPA